jgi:hypothetical protein
VIIGTAEQYPTEAEGWRAAESFRLAASSRTKHENVLFGALVDVMYAKNSPGAIPRRARIVRGSRIT